MGASRWRIRGHGSVRPTVELPGAPAGDAVSPAVTDVTARWTFENRTVPRPPARLLSAAGIWWWGPAVAAAARWPSFPARRGAHGLAIGRRVPAGAGAR